MAPLIAIDARKIHDFGIGTYIRCLVEEIARSATGFRYVILGPSRQHPALQGLPEGFEVVAERAPVYSLRELVSVPHILRRVRADLYHATHYVLPPSLPCPAVVTIHDLIHLVYPEFLPGRVAHLYARWMLRHSTRGARRIIAVSEHTAGDLRGRLGVDGDRIDVIPNGVEERFFAPLPDCSRATALRRHDLEAGYVLFVGNPKPHKNLDGVLRGYAAARAQGIDLPPLVCVGAASERGAILQRAEALDVSRHLRLPGFVDDADLPALYRGAMLLVQPSLYEGFGLPVVEAMAAGTPVITSSTSSLAEVAGDAAVLVDPLSPCAIRDALIRLHGDEGERLDLSRRGSVRARDFRWDRAAAATVRSYRRALGEAA